MPFRTSYNTGLGQQSFNINDVDNVQKVALGTIIRGYDPLLGEGEFIYLPGAAGAVANAIVAYDLLPGGATVLPLTVTIAANTGRPVAVAVVAVGAGQFGWYQIGGCTICNAVAGTAAGVLFLSATTGQVSSVADPGDQVLGGRISSAVGVPAAGKVYLTLNRPVMQSQLT